MKNKVATRINEPPRLLDTLARRSANAILLERAWRVAAGLAALALAFLAASFAGLWLHLGVAGKMAGVAAFGAAGLFIVLRALARGLPKRSEALARLDAAAPAPLRPAASFDDSLAGQTLSPETRALWAAHRRRLEKALAETPVAPPAPRMEERDPFALRALALVAAVAAGFAAGDDKSARLRAAFDWRMAGDAAARVDAWLDPPPYTGRPPIVLPAQQETGGEPMSAPFNSVLHARFTQGAVQTNGGLEALPETPPQGKSRAFAGEREQSFKLTGAARIALPDGRSFELAAIPDRAPTIELLDPPRNNTRGSMTLTFRAEDDYGVVGADAVFTRPNGPTALYPPPRLPLGLPPGRNGLGEARSTLDLADNPWAGARLTLTLIARDEGGNEGGSAPTDVTLPQRRFSNPLARALAEQRRNLALDPVGERVRVLSALNGLSIAPELFGTPSSAFLGLRAAQRGLEGRRTDDELRQVVDLLWAIALSLEDGDQSQAERDLRAAQDKLRDAMARGADDGEIAALTQQLRDALDKFMEGLRERAGREDDKGAPRQGEGSGKTLSEQDIQSMLDELNKALKSGDTARAQELLDELQDIMENVQTSKGGGASGGQRERQMSKALSELDALAREQQRLRDDTFRDMQSGKGGETGDPGNGRERQQGLRERLEREQQALRGAGEDPGGDLDMADKAMKEAENSLGLSGGRGKAVDAQGRALEALRRGADKLAEAMRNEAQNGGQQGGGEGQGGGPGRARGQAEGENRDPLGRRPGSRRGDNANARYDPLGLPPALRAHRVQEELRRRLGQPERPVEELDYLQRLLRR